MSEETLATLAWLVPAGPLLVFFLIVLFTNRNKTLSWVLSWLGVGAALVLGWTIAISVMVEGLTLDEVHHLAEHPVVAQSSLAWLPIGQFSEWLRMGVAVDPLTAVMLIMVTFAITMIFIYSVGYHNFGNTPGSKLGVPNHGKEEPLFSRFFAFMSLFAGAMLTLVVADNLLLVFMGWEVMGLCSYLLIGFWYAREYEPDPKNPQKLPPRYASIKAFMTTRVGDVFMLLGIVAFYRLFGTLNFSEAFTAESLSQVAGISGGLVAVMVLLLFAGTVGKSAQFPLHVWLPNAMEGPTPVSAVIHAAAMVSAGVYLIVRLFPLLSTGMEASPAVSLVIGGIGAFTALMAATIAVAQDDVKGVLAYSTISQLGFMVAALGIGAYVAAAFHLITHGFFKALLFLGSGSIIHGMEHGAEHVHDHHTDPQDMMNMGGLRQKMPITFWTFVAGGFALSGFPLVTAGFWSKDEIFAEAWHQGAAGNGLAMVIFIVLAIAALLTAFYTMRQISLTFLGKPRTPLAEHAHESNSFMTLPLIGLAIFAVAAGWAGIPESFPVLGPLVNYNFFHHFVGSTVEVVLHELHEVHAVAYAIETIEFSWVPLAASLIVALGGLTLGWLVYGRKPLQADQPDPLIAPLGPLHTFLLNKWYWDEFYQAVFIRPTVYISEVVMLEWVDRGIIDGTLHLVARTVYNIGAHAKRFEDTVISGGVDWVKDRVLGLARIGPSIQSGKIQEYLWYSMALALALVVFLVFLPYLF